LLPPLRGLCLIIGRSVDVYGGDAFFDKGLVVAIKQLTPLACGAYGQLFVDLAD
jgi:hypothetical protein